jgi:arginine/lysine/ornithine decarboxylase
LSSCVALGRDLRERLGLTYWIDVEIRNLKAHRLLIIATQGEHRKMSALIQGSQYHLQQLFEHTNVTKDEFESAKSVYLWHQLMRQSTPSDRLLSIVDQRHHQANWRSVAELSYAQFVDWLHVWQTAPTYIFVSGETKALQHYLCEYFTPCHFIK